MSLVEVAGLRVEDGTGRRVLDDVSLALDEGQTIGIVGESGSGKTTIARCVAGLHRPEAGTITLDGVPLDPDVRRRSPEQRRQVQLIPQDPLGSLNPRLQAGDAVARPLRVLYDLDRDAARDAVAYLLQQVRLDPALARRYPSQLSGGQRQRLASARALAAKPDLLVCDEITSSLDTSVQATVLDLLDDLRRDLGLSLLFVSHDLGLVTRVADHLVVLDHGQVCEQGRLATILATPTHPHTRALLAAHTAGSLHLQRKYVELSGDGQIPECST